MALLASSASALAHNKVVVVPLGGNDSKPLQNVITVAKANGDFTDPIAAMASITDASEENPYLIIIAPGSYQLNQQLVMRSFVNITGSGLNSTSLYGSIGGATINEDAALVVGANDSLISNISIQNGANGSQDFLIGFYNESESPTIDNVAISVEEGNIGTIAIVNRDSTALIKDSEISVFTNSLGVGISNDDSKPTISRVRISIHSSGLGSLGITNAVNSFATIQGASISLSGSGDTRIAISNGGGSSFRVTSSTIIGATTAINASTGSGSNETYVSNSVIEGGITGDPKCSFIFLSDGTGLDSNCNTP